MNRIHSHARLFSKQLRRPSRKRALSLCLSIALAVPLLTTSAGASPSAAQNWIVKNCNDSGTDSLRDTIENPMKAQSGDSVDLSELPTDCAMNSTITLGSEITVAQDDLSLYGPPQGSVTISGAGMSRAFHHKGAGTLSLNALTVTEGYYHSVGDAYGGCVESDSGDVFLSHVTISHCTVMSDTGYAIGGGVSAALGNITLIASKISGNEAKIAAGDSMSGWGGGVYSNGSMFAWYSSISGNTAYGGSLGGGVNTRGGGTFIASTIDNNNGGYGGGIAASGGTTILDSTISSNTASELGGGIFARFSASLQVANSTIAANQSGSTGAGILFACFSASDKLTLQSSIVADNTAGAASTPSDVYIYPGFGSLAGADNLVIASNVTDPVVITVTADPKLGPLQLNGGPTMTHMLLPGSPALGKGNTDGLFPSITTEQRGVGYPRTSGPGASVDLGAVQFDSIFADGFNSPF